MRRQQILNLFQNTTLFGAIYGGLLGGCESYRDWNITRNKKPRKYDILYESYTNTEKYNKLLNKILYGVVNGSCVYGFIGLTFPITIPLLIYDEYTDKPW